MKEYAAYYDHHSAKQCRLQMKIKQWHCGLFGAKRLALPHQLATLF